MRNAGLKGCSKRRCRVTTKSGLARAENLLEQDFSAESIQSFDARVTIRRPFVTKVTEVLLDLGFRHLCGYHNVRRHPFFSFRTQIVRSPVIHGSRYEYRCSKHLKFHRLNYSGESVPSIQSFFALPDRCAPAPHPSDRNAD